MFSDSKIASGEKIFELNLSLCKDYVPLELGGTVPILYTMALLFVEPSDLNLVIVV
jgi:hypothetical protein